MATASISLLMSKCLCVSVYYILYISIAIGHESLLFIWYTLYAHINCLFVEYCEKSRSRGGVSANSSVSTAMPSHHNLYLCLFSSANFFYAKLPRGSGLNAWDVCGWVTVRFRFTASLFCCMTFVVEGFFFSFPIESHHLNLRKKLVKCYIWCVALYGAETWTIRAID
jgi:hypothetical protein